MATRKVQPADNPPPRRRPARTPEARENQLISMAFDLAEERLRNGTASSAEVVTLMKRGLRDERLNDELIATKIELMRAKKEALESAKRIEDLYGEAIAAFRRYNGVFDEGEEDDGEDL